MKVTGKIYVGDEALKKLDEILAKEKEKKKSPTANKPWAKKCDRLDYTIRLRRSDPAGHTPRHKGAG